MFRVVRNMAMDETNLVGIVEKRLRARLPREWKVQIRRQPRGTSRPDALLNLLSPDGTKAIIAIEAISSNAARYLRNIIETMDRVAADVPAAAVSMAVSSYFSPRAREQLRTKGYGYADPTGNFYLALNDPPVFIEAVGSDRDPSPEDRPLQSLRGPAAGRSVRALVDYIPPYGIRELSERADTPAPTLSRVADFLQRQGIVSRERPRGPIVSVDWAAAIRLWAQDYAFSRSNKTSTWLEPRGLSELERKLMATSTRYAVTGSLAANALAPVTVPRLAALYVDRPETLAKQLSLRLTDTGGNVILAEPYDPVALERGFEQEGLRFAGCSQVAVDLLTGPGRWPSEAEELLRWMADNEPAWRS